MKQISQTQKLTTGLGGSLSDNNIAQWNRIKKLKTLPNHCEGFFCMMQ